MELEKRIIRNDASFRDPAATVYLKNSKIIRAINPAYFPEYDHFKQGLYRELYYKGLILPYTEVSRDNNCIVVEPALVPFISYPFEWSFDMLKEAALNTLRINQIALKHGMMLKDATAYNIQYYQGRMVLIDTTSFMFYDGNMPWASYPQFLRHFLNPLLWLKYCSSDMRRLSEIYLDGIPVSLTNHMLPLRSRFNIGILVHVWAQSLSKLFREPKSKKVSMNRVTLDSLLGNLYNLINKLNYKPIVSKNDWLNYSDAGSYTPEALACKKSIVKEFLDPCYSLLDLGANTGEYSKIAIDIASQITAIDSDHDCIHYLFGTPGIIPLVVDICNPSPGIGWANTERPSFWNRVGRVDTILALAIVHHLSVSNNVPLEMVADLFADHCKTLIIEWVPLEDKQAQKLLGTKNIPEYSHGAFARAFQRRFYFIKSKQIPGSERIIYKMKNREVG